MTRFDIAMLLLRVFFGLSMTYHGLNKLRGNGLQGTTTWFASIGMKHPRKQALLASSSEMLAGVLLAIGLSTILACTMFIALMFVAIWTVHWKIGFFIFLQNGGWEYCASILIMATSIALVGPGQASFDHLLGISNDLGFVALPLGVMLGLCHVALWYRPKKLSMTS